MVCKKCGYNNIEEALFCKNCGAKLTKDHNKIFVGILVGILAVVLIAIAVFLTVRDGGDNGSEETTSPKLSIQEKDQDGIHRYSYFLEDCGWNRAFEQAQKKGGYLAHINSEEEFNYIVGELEQQGYHKMQFYIGGRRDADKSYYWTDERNETYGDPLEEYMGDWFWMRGEPSYFYEGTEEEYMNIFFFKGQNRWVANDTTENPIVQVPEFRGKVGYIVEFDD